MCVCTYDTEREREGDLSHVTDGSRSTVSLGWTSVLGLGLGQCCTFSLRAIGLLFQGGKILFFPIKTFYWLDDAYGEQSALLKSTDLNVKLILKISL